MKVNVKWTGDMSFTAVTGMAQVEVPMDTSPDFGGSGKAATPMELVLIGLAGCSGMDAVSILKKKRVEFDTLEIAVSGERTTEHPKVFTDIHVVYKFSGVDLDAKAKALEDSIILSMEKYCSVAGMINKTANITWELEIAAQ